MKVAEVEALPYAQYKEWLDFFETKDTYEKWQAERRKLNLPLEGFFNWGGGGEGGAGQKEAPPREQVESLSDVSLPLPLPQPRPME
jgi:hypothetical protein